jgi:hypothetical protein
MHLYDVMRCTPSTRRVGSSPRPASDARRRGSRALSREPTEAFVFGERFGKPW